jgi:hypothetical protein
MIWFLIFSANSVEDPVRRGQRQVEQVKAKMSMQMDDRTFQATVIETQVRILHLLFTSPSLMLFGANNKRLCKQKISQNGIMKHCKTSLMD